VFSRPLGFVYLVSWVQITGISFNFWPLECYKEIPLNWILNFKKPSAHRPRTRRAAEGLHPPHCQIFGDERILIAWADCPWDKPAAAPAVCHWWLCKFWWPRHDPIRGGKHMGFLTRGCTQTIHKIDQKSTILVLKPPISIYLHINPMTKNGLRNKGVFWLISEALRSQGFSRFCFLNLTYRQQLIAAVVPFRTVAFGFSRELRVCTQLLLWWSFWAEQRPALPRCLLQNINVIKAVDVGVTPPLTVE
jgi:hypothetical protein